MVNSSAWSQMLSQKVALYTNVCIHVTDKMLSFLIILCSEIAERFGLPLLENSPRQTVRRECFSQELPLPLQQRCQAAPRRALPTLSAAQSPLPVLCRVAASWICFLQAFPGPHVSWRRDTSASCKCSQAPAPAQGEAQARIRALAHGEA